MLLPVVLICMMLMVNNKKIMGEHVNKTAGNIIGWSTIGVLTVLTVILTLQPLFK